MKQVCNLDAQYAPNASAAGDIGSNVLMAHSAAAPDDYRRARVRSVADLEALDEVEKPIFLVVSSLQDDTSR